MQSKAESGKRLKGDCCASSHPTSHAMYGGLLPSVRVRVGERDVSALVDTGCTKSLVHVGIAGECYGQSNLIAFDGTNVRCLGLSKVMLVVNNQAVVTEMMVVESIVCDFKVVLGMDVIKQLGGVTVGGGVVTFGGVCVMKRSVLTILRIKILQLNLMENIGKYHGSGSASTHLY